MDVDKATVATDGTREATVGDELDGCVEASEHINAGHISPIAAFPIGKSTSFGRCLDL